MKYVKILLLFAAVGIATGFYLYNKPVKSTSQRSVDVVVKSEDLFSEFVTDENAANSKYLDKVVAIEGEVTNVAREDGMLVLTLKTSSDMFGVVCKMEPSQNSEIKTGQRITLKGVCTGVLMDVVMVRCVLT